MSLGIVFDLDDTLYLERDYVRSGFRAVAEAVGEGHAEDAFTFMWGLFTAGVRGVVFNRLLERYPELAETYSVTDLVALYREHAPEIDFLPEMKELLLELRASGAKLGVISDGPLASQQAKAEALNVSCYTSHVILTDRWGQRYWKPHPRAFQETAEVFGLSAERLVYVGDNPEKDFHAPTRLGWQSVRLRLPEQVRHELPHKEVPPTWEVGSVAALRERLLSLMDG